MNKRTLSIFLALLLCTSCGTAEVAEDTTTTQPEETTQQSAFDKLPTQDFGGMDFNLLIYSDDQSPLTFFDCDEQTGEVLDDAIFRRNAAVEERFNIKINTDAFPTQNANMYTAIGPNVMAGDEPYSLYVMHTSQGPIGVLTDNLAMNWRDLSSVDLEAAWWNQTIHEEIEIDGYLPFAVSDFDLPSYAFSTALIFSKNVLAEYKLEDPYALVREGKWTLDKFSEQVIAASGDADGNGIFDESDQYGFASNITYHPQAFLTSSDLKMVSMSKDGFSLTMDMERFDALLGGLHTLFNVEKVTFRIPHDELCPIPFDNDQILHTLVWLSQLEYYRDSNADYGIIPLPKLDETQDRYYTLANRRGCVMTIPINAADPERTGLIVEALSILSHESVIPVYYDTILSTKYTRDEQSLEMLEIITDGIKYDFGYFYPHNYTSTSILNLLKNASTASASYFASHLDSAQVYYQEILDYHLANK